MVRIPFSKWLRPTVSVFTSFDVLVEHILWLGTFLNSHPGCQHLYWPVFFPDLIFEVPHKENMNRYCWSELKRSRWSRYYNDITRSVPDVCGYPQSQCAATRQRQWNMQCVLIGASYPHVLITRSIFSRGSSGQVVGTKKHEICAAAFGGHLFYDLFLQGQREDGHLAPPHHYWFFRCLLSSAEVRLP